MNTSSSKLHVTNKLDRYSHAAREVLAHALEEANRQGHSTIEPQHILLGLLRDSGVAGQLFAGQHINLDVARRMVDELSDSTARLPYIDLTSATKILLDSAVSIADRKSSQLVEPEHLMMAMLDQENSLTLAVLQKLGLSSDALRQQLDQE